VVQPKPDFETDENVKTVCSLRFHPAFEVGFEFSHSHAVGILSQPVQTGVALTKPDFETDKNVKTACFLRLLPVS
jgi:hypothetical protein